MTILVFFSLREERLSSNGARCGLVIRTQSRSDRTASGRSKVCRDEVVRVDKSQRSARWQGATKPWWLTDGFVDAGQLLERGRCGRAVKTAASADRLALTATRANHTLGGCVACVVCGVSARARVRPSRRARASRLSPGATALRPTLPPHVTRISPLPPRTAPPPLRLRRGRLRQVVAPARSRRWCCARAWGVVW